MSIIRDDFAKELEILINKYCLENDSDTPDFILAEFLMSCLTSLNKSIQNRDSWLGNKKITRKKDDISRY